MEGLRGVGDEGEGGGGDGRVAGGAGRERRAGVGVSFGAKIGVIGKSSSGSGDGAVRKLEEVKEGEEVSDASRSRVRRYGERGLDEQ